MKKSLLLFCFLVIGFSVSAQQVMTIKEARNAAPGVKVTVAGIITTDANFDSFLRYFQDATGGLVVYSQNLESLKASGRGDSVVVSGILKDYNGLLEIVDFSETEKATLNVIKKGVPIPTPLVTDAAGLKEENEGKLIRIEDVTFKDAGGTFSANRNYTFTDLNGKTGVIRIVGSKHPLAGKDIPNGLATVTGVLGEYKGTYQLQPRDDKDFVVGLSLSKIDQSDIRTTGFHVNWATNLKTTPKIYFKEVGSNSVDSVVGTTSGFTHSLAVNGLKPAAFYEVEVVAVTAEGKSAKAAKVFSTKSHSRGIVKAYFNHTLKEEIIGPFSSVDFSKYQIKDGAFADTIASYINNAKFTVDVAVYNSNDVAADKIFTALNNAAARGVQVRYIADAETGNSGLKKLSPTIPVLKDNGSGIMHNKYVVVDAGSVNNSWVITASANWTTNGFTTDPNNMVLVQDQALAKAYEVEFEEMWGGSEATPNTVNAKFGSAKTDNTPTKFMVGDKLIEVYFSPSDGTTTAISNALSSVNSDIRYALNLLTENELANKIIELQEKGWSVRGIIHEVADSVLDGSTYTQTGADYGKIKKSVDALAGKAGIYDAEVFPYNSEVSVLHHKYAIVDALAVEQDPLVITGSHNWSNGANTVNDENTLIIHDALIANIFLAEWRQRYREAAGKDDQILTATEEDVLATEVKMYPNPTNNYFNLSFGKSAKKVDLAIFDLTAKSIYRVTITNSEAVKVDVSGFRAGIYLVKATVDNQVITKKLIIE